MRKSIVWNASTQSHLGRWDCANRVKAGADVFFQRLHSTQEYVDSFSDEESLFAEET